MDHPPSINWHAYEYHHQPKSADWFWAVTIIAICIAITSVIYGDFLFAILVVIAGAALVMFAVRRPELIAFELNSKGLMVERKMYPYASLESFWLDEESFPRSKILIKSKKLAMPLIVVPIEEVFDEEVRKFLLFYLPEEQHFEPVSQKIMEYLGF